MTCFTSVIVCWIPVEPDQPKIYPTRKEALRDLENYALMQPENIFRIVRVQPGEYSDRTGGKHSNVKR